MAPTLTCHHRQHGSSDEMRCFQVLGFDVMLGHDFKAYLLEVNNSPSISIDEALPIEPDMGEEKLCRCMDMAEVHRHQTSLVDLEVKSAVMRETFQALLGIDTDGSVESENFMHIPVSNDSLWQLLARVEAFYYQAGGASKAFTSTGLRRTFGPLSGTGGLEKQDLDMLSQRCRSTRFVSRDKTKPDALRLFDFLDAVLTLGQRAYPEMHPRMVVEQVLSQLT